MGKRRSGPSMGVILVPINNHKVGFYNDYNYRQEFNSTIGETCENNLDFDGVVFGKFICPIEGLHALF